MSNDTENYSTTAASNTADWPEGMPPSAVNDAGRESQADIRRWKDRIDGTATATGTVDAITATFSPALTALYDGRTIVLRAAGANATTTPTFSPDGLTAKTIVKDGNQALLAGDIYGAGHFLILKYNTANDVWELLNPSPSNLVTSTLTDTYLWKLLDSTTVSGASVATVDFTGLTAHDSYLVLFKDVKPVSDNVTFSMRQGYGATPTYITASYKYHVDRSNDSAATYLGQASATSGIFPVAQTCGNAVGEYVNGQLFIYNSQSANSPAAIDSHVVHLNQSGNLYKEKCAGFTTNNYSAITALRFYFSTGNVDLDSTIEVYGLAAGV